MSTIERNVIKDIKEHPGESPRLFILAEDENAQYDDEAKQNIAIINGMLARFNIVSVTSSTYVVNPISQNALGERISATTLDTGVMKSMLGRLPVLRDVYDDFEMLSMTDPREPLYQKKAREITEKYFPHLSKEEQEGKYKFITSDITPETQEDHWKILRERVLHGDDEPNANLINAPGTDYRDSAKYIPIPLSSDVDFSNLFERMEIINHNVRNALTRIIGSLQMVQLIEKDRQRFQRMYEIADSGFRSLNAILDTIPAQLRREYPQKEVSTYEAQKIIQETMAPVLDARGIALLVDDLPDTIADTKMMSWGNFLIQIADNLAQNAVRAQNEKETNPKYAARKNVPAEVRIRFEKIDPTQASDPLGKIRIIVGDNIIGFHNDFDPQAGISSFSGEGIALKDIQETMKTYYNGSYGWETLYDKETGEKVGASQFLEFPPAP